MLITLLWISNPFVVETFVFVSKNDIYSKHGAHFKIQVLLNSSLLRFLRL